MATATPQKAKKSKKQRKVGRNAAACLQYKNSHRREHNKARRLARHLKRFPGDAVAVATVAVCKAAARGG